MAPLQTLFCYVQVDSSITDASGTEMMITSVDHLVRHNGRWRWPAIVKLGTGEQTLDLASTTWRICEPPGSNKRAVPQHNKRILQASEAGQSAAERPSQAQKTVSGKPAGENAALEDASNVVTASGSPLDVQLAVQTRSKTMLQAAQATTAGATAVADAVLRAQQATDADAPSEGTLPAARAPPRQGGGTSATAQRSQAAAPGPKVLMVDVKSASGNVTSYKVKPTTSIKKVCSHTPCLHSCARAHVHACMLGLGRCKMAESCTKHNSSLTPMLLQNESMQANHTPPCCACSKCRVLLP